MEHDWGRGVFEWGLINTGCTLAARLPDPLGTTTFVLTNEEAIGTRVWEIPADTLPDVPYAAYTLSGSVGNFPYGYDVSPDSPL